MFKPATSDDSTQTEDCAFYEMMGSRFSNELDYYQRMNMKGLGTTRIDTGAGVGMWDDMWDDMCGSIGK